MAAKPKDVLIEGFLLVFVPGLFGPPPLASGSVPSDGANGLLYSAAAESATGNTPDTHTSATSCGEGDPLVPRIPATTTVRMHSEIETVCH